MTGSSEDLPAPADPRLGRDEPWHWNDSLVAPRRSKFGARFIRFTTWTYVALVVAPVPVAVVLGVQEFPRFAGPALASVIWGVALAAFYGVLIAPVVGFVGAIAATIVGGMRACSGEVQGKTGH